MTTNTAAKAAPTPTASLPRLRSAAVLSALGLIPAVVLTVLVVASSDRFARCLTYGDYYTDCSSVSGDQLGWALAVAGLALVFVLAVPDRARRVKELRTAGLCVQLFAELTFLSMLLSNA
ncbi:hypothetical protein [Streptomyces melanogenes]|uniref:Integral membrane protein n=1 Tax=Streptomyces melanogenes TaxID=67326 RepID=A0ABZ1XIQ5_9ACTN|nr:hypothetical protein [Streptomyces melanogenes]